MSPSLTPCQRPRGVPTQVGVDSLRRGQAALAEQAAEHHAATQQAINVVEQNVQAVRQDVLANGRAITNVGAAVSANGRAIASVGAAVSNVMTEVSGIGSQLTNMNAQLTRIEQRVAAQSPDHVLWDENGDGLVSEAEVTLMCAESSCARQVQRNAHQRCLHHSRPHQGHLQSETHTPTVCLHDFAWTARG